MLKRLLFLVYGFLFLVSLTGCRAIGTARFAALQIATTPQASVFLDGKHLGKTPFYSDQLLSGEHTLKVTAGQASYSDKISLKEGILTVVERDLADNFLAQSGEVLTLASGKRGLLIISMPQEASVTLDGKLAGKTPLSINSLAEGDHKLLLTKEGYLEREFAIKTSKKYQLQADVTLASQIAKQPVASLQPPVSKIEITSTSQGFLRVRQDASLGSAEIGRVKPGDQLEVIQEAGDWLKIKFIDKEGWVAKEYTRKL